MLAVECSELSKEYLVGFWRKRRVRGLERLSLTVESGEVFGFLGHNGAGKTTTIKLLLRLIFPTSGTARILGQPLGTPGVAAQVGYLPENPYFYDYLTCRELLTYYAQLGGVSAAETRERVKWALERVGAAEFADRPLRKCSKGMLQRVGLAQAIVHRPRLVFLDEPMSGLDPLGRREVRDLMLELKQQGTAVLFSTHILSDAEELCDRVAILHRGQLRGVGRPDALLSAGESRLEITFRGGGGVTQGAQAVPGRSGEFCITSARVQAWEVLDQLRRHGAELVSVVPLRLRLEEIFLLKTADAPAVPTAASPKGSQPTEVSMSK